MTNNGPFESELLPHLAELSSYATRLCGHEQSAPDLVQETLLKALLFTESYRQGTNCRAWLFQICKNSYINHYRRKRLLPVAVDFQHAESGEGDGRLGDRREVRILPVDKEGNRLASFGDEVLNALASLPPDYQTAVLLCDVEDQTYEEIAQFMGAPVGTIRSRIHRGRKMLAAVLQEYARSLGYET